MTSGWRRVWRAGSELVLGARCPGCAAGGLGVCASCRSIVTRPPVLPPDLPAVLPPVVAGGWYADELRNLLLAAKERQSLGVVPVLSARLAAAVARLLLDQPGLASRPVILVPVPTARAAAAERGLDLTAELARRTAAALRGTGVAASASPALGLVRRPSDQADLGREGRLANLTGAFAVRSVPPSGAVVVVDDIITTGATLTEAVRALATAGRPAAGAAAVAATPRRLPH